MRTNRPEIRFTCSVQQIRESLKRHCKIENAVISDEDDIHGAMQVLFSAMNIDRPSCLDIVTTRCSLDNGTAIVGICLESTASAGIKNPDREWFLAQARYLQDILLEGK
jgi:hypothetical protein